jgi:hypothetical protein
MAILMNYDSTKVVCPTAIGLSNRFFAKEGDSPNQFHRSKS